MLLDTTLLVPKVSPLINEDTTLDFVDVKTTELLMLPPSPDVKRNEPLIPESMMRPTPADTASGPPGLGQDMELPIGITGMIDTFIVDTARAAQGEVLLTEATPEPEIPGYDDFDTLVVFQEAERYVITDLTGDGIEEIIATYPARLFRIWQRELNSQPYFISLWPRSYRMGSTSIGAEITATGDGISRRQIITNSLPGYH